MSDVFPDPDGILPVDKPAGMPSHVIVTTLRRKFGFAKVGHGGTLDPDATGLLAAIEAAIARDFLGDLFQKPPMYSAVKVAGQPLYRLAVRGEECEREERFIHVYAFKLTAFRPAPQKAEADFEVRCSKGTYVRTLAHDLGQALGCGAHLCALRRVAAGPVGIDRATPFADLLEMTRPEIVARVIPCPAYLAGTL